MPTRTILNPVPDVAQPEFLAWCLQSSKEARDKRKHSSSTKLTSFGASSEEARGLQKKHLAATHGQTSILRLNEAARLQPDSTSKL